MRLRERIGFFAYWLSFHSAKGNQNFIRFNNYRYAP